MTIRPMIAVTIVACGLGLAACSSDADVASRNVSKDADNFKVYRQIVFYNGITDKYVAEVDGYCSLGNDDPPQYTSVTCRMPDGTFIKDHFFKSDNTTIFSLQSPKHASNVSTQRYKVIFKPSTIIPDVEAR